MNGTIEIRVIGASPSESTLLAAELKGLATVTRTATGEMLVTAKKRYINEVRGLIEARGLNIARRPV